jgi:hypothetical protein
MNLQRFVLVILLDMSSLVTMASLVLGDASLARILVHMYDVILVSRTKRTTRLFAPCIALPVTPPAYFSSAVFLIFS